MPELPEVETIRRQLEPSLVGRTVEEAWAFPSPKFDEAPAATGLRVDAVGRRGKYLLVSLSPTGPAPDRPSAGQAAHATNELVIHLGMTGRLGVHPGPAPSDEHLRAWWALDGDEVLTFHDVRRFGRIAVVAAGRYDRLPTLAALGPEPDDDAFTAERLRAHVNGSTRYVKTQLLSQRPVAGVGNIYADEALWRAEVHPRSRRLTRAASLRVRDAVRDVLAEGIAHGGTTLRDYRDATGGAGSHQHALDCYGRAGQPCHRCGAVLRGGVVDARGTTWCPSCQRRS